MKVAIVILNYNSWKKTLNMVKQIKQKLQSPSVPKYRIVVVDNASTDKSDEVLSRYAGKHYVYLKAEQNGGYAKGNNMGIRWAREHGYAYSWILNNDILLPDAEVLQIMISAMKEAGNAGAVSPNVFAPTGHQYNREIFRKNMWEETLGGISWRIRSRKINVKDMDWLYVYRPQGCCMLLDNECMEKVGDLDENTFLYYEESILAERLLSAGYRVICANRTSVIHDHSDSVSFLLGKIRYRREYGKSYIYYLTHYRGYYKYAAWICWCFLQLKLFFV